MNSNLLRTLGCTLIVLSGCTMNTAQQGSNSTNTGQVVIPVDNGTEFQPDLLYSTTFRIRGTSGSSASTDNSVPQSVGVEFTTDRHLKAKILVDPSCVDAIIGTVGASPITCANFDVSLSKKVARVPTPDNALPYAWQNLTGSKIVVPAGQSARATGTSGCLDSIGSDLVVDFTPSYGNAMSAGQTFKIEVFSKMTNHDCYYVQQCKAEGTAQGQSSPVNTGTYNQCVWSGQDGTIPGEPDFYCRYSNNGAVYNVNATKYPTCKLALKYGYWQQQQTVCPKTTLAAQRSVCGTVLLETSASVGP